MKKIALILGATLSLISADAFANEFDVNLRMGSQITTDSSFDALQDSNLLPYTTLQLGYGITEGSLKNLRFFLSYDGSGLEANSRDLADLDLEWSRQRFMLGAEYGINVWDMFRPLAGVGAGYALQKMTVNADDTRSDFTHDVAAEAFLGLDYIKDISTFDSGTVLRLVAGGRLGWQMQTEARFDELDSESSDVWNRPDNDLGVLETDGMFWNLGIGLSAAF